MPVPQSQSYSMDWIKMGLLSSVGGMLFAFTSLWAVTAIGEWLYDGRFVTVGSKLGWLSGLDLELVFDFGIFLVVLVWYAARGFFESLLKSSVEASIWVWTTLGAYFLALVVWTSYGPVMFAIVTGVVGVAFVFRLLLGLTGLSNVQSSELIMIWLIGYATLWWVASVFGMSLSLYIVLWLVAGVVSGGLLSSASFLAGKKASVYEDSLDPIRHIPRGSNLRQTAPTARRLGNLQVSSFGRIPEATVIVLTQQIRRVTTLVLSGLPLAAGASSRMRAITVRLVLDRTLQDWWENGNSSGLEPADLDDLRSFVEFAADLRGGSYTPEELAIYRVTLSNLLDDWLHHWNADGVDGPPRRS